MGKTAFVTGGASGIGLALGRAFAEAGMNVVLADIEVSALQEAVDELRPLAPAALGVVCDVADADSVERAARTAIEAFGKVHVLCNNAGVAGGGGVDDISLSTWKWVLDTNVMGVLHGVAAFLPHMRAHKEGGHIVNTASMAGFQSRLGFSPYATSKYAVVAISEGLAQELQPHGIGVTVLCPSFVRTRISESSRNRPARYGPAEAPDPRSAMGALTTHIAERVRSGMDPAEVAARTVSAIREGELYVFTHPEARGEIDERFAAITAALDAAGSGGTY
jgi:NAD(P)-dependent dehydrogenase (short-subunit alcohol dehydrogenase family)